jgi:hypothetical protein
MSLLDMIEGSAGSDALQQIGSRVGLSPEQLQNVIASVAPALAPKLAQHADTGALDGTPAATTPPVPGSDAATDHGNDVLGSIFGSKDASRSVAADASAQTGVSVDRIKAVLPQLASIAAVAFLAHRASAQGGGGLGGLFSSVEKGFGLS